MRDTVIALGDILFMERGIAPEKVSKAFYKVSIEFLKKPKTVEARKVFLNRVIEESLLG